MAEWGFLVIDCDGHLVESILDLADFLGPGMRHEVLTPRRNREGVFPSLDGFHGPRLAADPPATNGREYVVASDKRKGSPEDCLAFMDRAGVDQVSDLHE